MEEEAPRAQPAGEDKRALRRACSPANQPRTIADAADERDTPRVAAVRAPPVGGASASPARVLAAPRQRY